MVLKMDNENEDFSETLNKYLVKKLKNRDYDRYKIDAIEDIVGTIKGSAEFLNMIPIEDREKACRTLNIWIEDYISSNYFNQLFNVMFTKPNQPSREIKKDLKTITTFETLIKDKIDIDFLKLSNKTKVQEVEDLLKIINDLKNDLETKELDIFNRYKYYEYETIPKTDLSHIIDMIKEDHNIKITTLEKKELIDNLTRLN
jgi:chemotaxis protein histidine kinase CheA